MNTSMFDTSRGTIPSPYFSSRCTRCGGLLWGSIQYTGDFYCKQNHDKEILSSFCRKIATQKDCPVEFVEIVNKEFWNLI